MNKRFLLIALAIFLVSLVPVVAAQSTDRAYFSAEKTTIVIGEPIHLALHLNIPQNAQLVLPDFTKSLVPFTVKNVGTLNLVQKLSDSSVEYEIPLEVVLWRTGTYQTPPLSVSYQMAGRSSVNLTVESLHFEVTSVLNDNDLTLRPFKPLVNLPYFPIGEALAIITVIVGVVAVLGWKRVAQMRKRASGQDRLAILGHPEAVYALKMLRDIELSNTSPVTIYAQVSDCLRNYLTKRYSVPALDLTTSELVTKLNEKSLFADEAQQKLAEMLKRADLVKFARVIPKQGAAQQYMSVASQWIQAVEQTTIEQPS
jgi:hypothetical protein